MWTWATYEAPPVLNLNLRGLLSKTDLMSLEAAEAEPDIFEVYVSGYGGGLGVTARFSMLDLGYV